MMQNKDTNYTGNVYMLSISKEYSGCFVINWCP